MIPPIEGETKDQQYKIWNMKIKGFGEKKPTIKVNVKKGIHHF